MLVCGVGAFEVLEACAYGVRLLWGAEVDREVVTNPHQVKRVLAGGASAAKGFRGKGAE